MSTYREIVGKKIKVVSSDPSSGVAGEMWYNSTTGALRGPAITEAWRSGASLINPAGYQGAAGTQTATIVFGGTGGAGYTNTSFTFDGNGWTTAPNMNTTRGYMAGCGTQTSALGAGGYVSPGGFKAEVEEFNGSAWSEQEDLPAGMAWPAVYGIETAAVASGGNTTFPGGAGVSSTTSEYNGESWTGGGALSTARGKAGASGIETAGLVFGGGVSSPPGYDSGTNLVEEYDGSSYSAGGVMPAYYRNLRGAGTQTSTLSAGGIVYPSAGPGGANTTNSFSYNGTSWTATPSLSSARSSNAQAGSGTSNLSAAGGGTGPGSPAYGVTVEEYDKSTTAYTAAAWASSGALGTARYQMGGAGNVPAGLAFGGYGTSIPGNTNKSDEYDGTSWTAANNMSNPRGQCSGQHIGTQTAALAAGGTLPGSPPYSDLCEEYDGTNWTTGGALNQRRSYLAGFGTLTAGVAASGFKSIPAGAGDNSEEYDGSSWTAGNAMNTARYSASGTGTLTAGVAVGQYPGTGTVEEYDGTNWTSVTSYPAGRFGIYGGMGTQTDCIYAGGSASSTRTTETFGYNGTSWSTRPALGNALSSGASGGTSTAGFIAGGRGSPPGPTAGVTTCEEFSGEASTASIKDFEATQS